MANRRIETHLAAAGVEEIYCSGLHDLRCVHPGMGALRLKFSEPGFERRDSSVLIGALRK